MTERPPDPKAQRAADIERLRCHMPAAMRDLPHWLVWKFIDHGKGSKPAKVPFYTSGKPRGWPRGKPKDGFPSLEHPQVPQGHPLDRSTLVSFEQALKCMQGSQHWAGIGFAFLPGDGLLGIDIDGAIDLETGEVSPLCQDIMARCPSYTERSVSGTGVHIILQGHTPKFKDDAIGLEVYCDSQYFTCTGAHWGGTPTEPVPVDPDALTYMRVMVERSIEAQKAEKAAVATALAQAAADGQPAKPKLAAVAGAPMPEKGKDFKAVNDAAMANLHDWVQVLFNNRAKPHTSEFGEGYRITSKALGRDLQEDLTITPGGIKDWGTRRGMSPIDLVVEFGGHSLKDALAWLAPLVGVTLSKPRPRLRSVPPPDDAGPASADERPDPPPPEETASASAAGGKGAGKGKGKGRGKSSKPEGESDGDGADDDIDWEKFNDLRANFALIYGTDTVWDGKARIIMKIANMAHAHGTFITKLWKGGQSTHTREATGRWTVMPDKVVFDPTEQADPNTHVNLFGGFPTEPKEGDVEPIKELIEHLTSRTADDEVERDEIRHFLMCWLAYPLQHRGAKLRSAVVMHGDEGAGKNFLTDLVVEIYGEYGITVGQDELEDKFNDWRSRKMFVVGDEVSSRAELVHNKNRLKALITSVDVQINPKNLPRRTERNHINVWFNSNELQPLALDNSDRRYLVIFTPRAREADFYSRLGKWKREGGMQAFYHYLLHYDLSGFDPFAHAPLTVAKQNLIDLNRKSPERFWLEWSDGQLALPYRACTCQQAYRAYLKYAQRTGDRFPVQQALFTSMVKRISDTMGRPCTDKVMKVDFAYVKTAKPVVTDETRPSRMRPTDVRPTRMLQVTEPPPGTPMGQWATECWFDFDIELRKYLGPGSRGGDGDDEQEIPPHV